MAGGIFLSYRRADSAGASLLLYQHLRRYVRKSRLFMDIEHIAPGLDFADVIDQTIAKSDVVLVVIGPRWLDERLNDPDDWVRMEVRAALKRKVRVVPVLVDGAKMPTSQQLPPDLQGLARRSAAEVRHTRFEADAEALIATLPVDRRPRWLPWATGAFGVAAVVGLAYVLQPQREAPAPSDPQTATAAPAPVASPAPEPAVVPGCVQDAKLGCLRRIPARRFLLMESEVTQRMWQDVMGTNPSNFSGCPDCPVETVSWDDAVAFARKVSGLTGFTYRLPTEAEWEYAARGGEDYEYSGSANVDAVAWYDGNSGGRTHAVCTKARNAYGLCDMSGNVWEWTADDYDGTGYYRVIRGGSAGSSAQFVRVADRSRGSPSGRIAALGLRLARSE